MAICYEQGNAGQRGPLPFNPARINPNTGYLRHYENYLLLKFVLLNGTPVEKAQASRELVTCERKLAWHENQPAFDRQLIQAEQRRLHAQWAGHLKLPSVPGSAPRKHKSRPSV